MKVERSVSADEAGRHLLARRTVNKAAVWAMPVIALAAAAPASAASNGSRVNLWSMARLPDARDGVHNGDNYYQGPRDCQFRYTFGNYGPDTLPTGATLTIGLPFASIWDDLIITGSGAHPLVAAGTSTVEIAPEPRAVRQLWHFSLSSEVPAGTQFDVYFTARMNGTNNTATNFWRVRTTSDFQPGLGVEDTEPENNSDFSDAYAFFNNVNAGG